MPINQPAQVQDTMVGHDALMNLEKIVIDAIAESVQENTKYPNTITHKEYGKIYTYDLYDSHGTMYGMDRLLTSIEVMNKHYTMLVRIAAYQPHKSKPVRITVWSYMKDKTTGTELDRIVQGYNIHKNTVKLTVNEITAMVNNHWTEWNAKNTSSK